MKKVLFLFILLIFIGISCDESDEYMIVSDGFIIETEASYYQYGTHTLKTSTGEILYALTSNSIDLMVYNDAYVEIKGNLIEGHPIEGGPKYLEVKSIKVID